METRRRAVLSGSRAMPAGLHHRTEKWRGCRTGSRAGCTVIYNVRACCARKWGIPEQVLPKDDIQVVDMARSKVTSICVRARTLIGLTMPPRAGELQVTGGEKRKKKSKGGASASPPGATKDCLLLCEARAQSCDSQAQMSADQVSR